MHRALEIPGPASLLMSVPSLGGGALPLSPLSEGKLLEAGPRAAGRGGNCCSRFSVLRSFPRERRLASVTPGGCGNGRQTPPNSMAKFTSFPLLKIKRGCSKFCTLQSTHQSRQFPWFLLFFGGGRLTLCPSRREPGASPKSLGALGGTAGI